MKLIMQLLFLAFFIISCGSKPSVTKKAPLRIGTSADYYPIIFKKDGKLQGVEADLARALSKELNRPIEFVELPFGSLIQALNSRRIDIIMAGMSVTEERSKYVKFMEPYMEISQMMLIRTAEMGRFRKPGNNYYVNSGMIVGVISGTTGEELALKHLKKERVKIYASIDQAVFALKGKRIDAFIHDAPYIWSYTQKNTDRSLTGVYWDLSQEKLAWGISLTNYALQQDLNKILFKWKMDGTKAKIVQKWVPYRINYAY